ATGARSWFRSSGRFRSTSSSLVAAERGLARMAQRAGMSHDVPLLRRALWERQRRLGPVEDGLDVVAVGVVYERSVVVLVVARPESGRAIVRRPGVERRWLSVRPVGAA